jgi:hypothetical protein
MPPAAKKQKTAAGSQKKATYDAMVREALMSFKKRGADLVNIKKKIKADYAIEVNATAVKSAIKKGIETGSIRKLGGDYFYVDAKAQTVQGKTWVTLAFSFGSGGMPAFTIFQKRSDLDFFRGKDSAGAPPTSYSDNEGFSLDLPVLSLEEAKKVVQPLLKHKTEGDASKSALVVKKYRNNIKKMFEGDHAKKRLEMESSGTGSQSCGLGLVILNALGGSDGALPLVVNADEEDALRKFISKALPDETDSLPWGYYDSEELGATYLTRVYMDAHAQDVDDMFEMAKRSFYNPYGLPGCL